MVITLKYIECSIPKGKLYYINDQNEFFSILVYKKDNYLGKNLKKGKLDSIWGYQEMENKDLIINEETYNVLLNNQIFPVKQLPKEVIVSVINWNTIFAKQIGND